jgi:hypothetical protein
LKSSKRSTSGAQRFGSAAKPPVPRLDAAASASGDGWAATSAAPCARGAQRRLQAAAYVDELPQPDRDCVRGLRGIRIVVGQLEAREHEQVVEASCALGVRLDLGEVEREA